MRVKHAGLAIASIAAAALATPVAAAPRVLDARFVYFEAGTETVSNKVPLVPEEVCFEWQLKLDVTDGPLTFTEVFILPAAPETWEIEPGTNNEISDNGMTSTTTDVAQVIGGWITHGWCLAEGDPLGDYRMEISVEGTLVHTFLFKLIEPGTLYL
jgi:hypothetical protein